MTNDMEHPVPISRALITLVARFNESLKYVFYVNLYPVRLIQNHLNDRGTSTKITGTLMHYCALVT